MVNLTLYQQTPLAEHSIRTAWEDALEQYRHAIAARHLRVEVDFDEHTVDQYCPSSLCLAISREVGEAINRSPNRGELSFSVCQSWRGVEIEITDSGPTFELTRSNAFSTHSMAAEYPIYFTKCPQGGRACTIVLQPPRARSMAA
ncbi:histidine kinase [Aureliella helgolandensis]|uniref:Histidine kinase/HSP90-like ATPase domain-containing protein n=1 Tax=Aureliella helgolandensis TaxID=2527968 RepID=A0A518GGA0_9BACT|nr:hypothetical protein [Aureliella helgolandensis]QDV27624.1 hypothetical protein Q31a_60170 [Aureliella helgolandensis]